MVHFYIYLTLGNANSFFNFYLLILEREKGGEKETERQRERERGIDLFFQLFMHSQVDSCMCPDSDQTPMQPWSMWMML